LASTGQNHTSRISVLQFSAQKKCVVQGSEFMDRPPEDDRPAMSLAYAWATRIIAIATTLIVPALVGVWIGQKFGTAWTIVLLLVGFVLGATGAVFQLMQITKDSKAFHSDGPPNRKAGQKPRNK
jgi:hypothetical protein